MKIYPINNVVQRTNLPVKKYVQQNTIEAEEKTQNLNFKGRCIPKSVKQLAASFGFASLFMVFPNPATLVASIFGAGGFFLAAFSNLFDDTDPNN